MDISTANVEDGTGPRLVDLPFSDAEFRRRLHGVRTRMREQGVDVFITFTPENLYYLNAHDTPGYYWYQACVISHDEAPITVVRLVEAGATLSMGWSRRAVIYSDRENPVDATLGLLRELGIEARSIGMEADAWFVSPRRYQALAEGIQKAGGRVVDASGTVESMRATKSQEELRYTREAAKIVVRGMAAAVEASHEGASENDIAAQAIAELVRSGGEYAGLPPFIASGVRSSICHVTWSGRVLQRGDVLTYELPGVVRRYCAALFRCGTVGQPTKEISKRAAATREALQAVIDAIRPGVTFQDVNRVHRQAMVKYGYGHLVRFQTAYSLGINYPPDWGEGHIIKIQDNDERLLAPGMVFHVGIGLYDLGTSVVETSETVAVTEDGCDVLTEFPRDLFVV